MTNVATKVTRPNENIDETKFPRSLAVSHQPDADETRMAPLGSVENPYKLGEKGSGVRLQGAFQDYHQLKEQCFAANKLFEDPEFPAEDSSIWALAKPKDDEEEVVWKRPGEMDGVDDPQFYVKGASRFDVKQGSFGDCWMVASVAVLATHEKLLKQVVPPGQGNFTENYAGIFRFRFWQFGKWVEVIIDDRLPMRGGELMGISSATTNEFWSALLGKAYAKLHGTWSVLEDGLSGDAFEDFTGGMTVFRDTKKLLPNFFEILLEAQERKALLACGTDAPKPDTPEYKKRNQAGIASAHAYSITKVMYYEKKKGNQMEKIPLLRLRNPWGFAEFNGAWSENSAEWKSVPKNKRAELGFVKKEDGEFWISFEDWKEYFTDCEICYLNINYFVNEEDKIHEKIWETSSFEGKWVRGASAGGRLKNVENFQHNPQYRITLEEESLVVVALMQKNRRTQRSKPSSLVFGFHIFKLPEISESGLLPKPLDADFFKENKPFLMHEDTDELTDSDKAPYIDFRQIYRRRKLEPGSYCIIPSCWDESGEGEFLLRVFSEKPNNMEEYDVQFGITKIDDTVRENSNYCKDVLKMRTIFRKYAGDDWELNWNEFAKVGKIKIREEMYDQGFSEDDYRSMVALMDEDRSGKIGYHEFQRFWITGKIFMSAFKKYDTFDTRILKPFLIKDVLKSIGLRASRNILNSLLQRYGSKDGHVESADCFMCAIRLSKMKTAYEELVTKEMTSAGLTLDKWIETFANFS